jgi:general secretion pathway protein H
MRRTRSAGFTLLELIMVLVIAGVSMAILIGFSGKGSSSADLKASARSIAAGLRIVQSTAMASRRDALLTLDLDTREFTFTGDTKTHRIPEGIEMNVFTAQSEVAGERKASIRFYPDGSSTGGRITVATAARKYMVDVEWLTGRVTVIE